MSDPTTAEEKERARSIKRMHVAQEILQTEKAYVDSLDACVNVWHLPLIEAYNAGNEIILEMEDITAVFSTLVPITSFHKQFLADMEQVILTPIATPTPSSTTTTETKENAETKTAEATKTADVGSSTSTGTTKPCPIPPGHIGALFKTFAPYLKMYTSYVNNHQRASERLSDIIQSKRKRFLQFTITASMDPRCKGNTLQSLLIKPVQRVPRYKLLLQELIKYTPETDPDYTDLKNAFESIETVAVHINNALRRQSNQADIYALQQQFTSAMRLMAPDRTLVYQGPAVKHGRHGESTYHFILFNDCLMYVTASRAGKLTYHRSLTINDSFTVTDLDPSPFFPAPLPNALQPDFGGTVSSATGEAAHPYALSTGALLLNKAAVDMYTNEANQAHARAQAQRQAEAAATPSGADTKEAPQTKDKNAKKRWSIQVFAVEKSFKMSWPTQAEKEVWLLHIRACMMDYRETVAQRQAEAAKALRSQIQTTPQSNASGSTSARPIQIPRTKASRCPGCNNGFGALELAVVWCRVCGAPAHSACASVRFYFDGHETSKPNASNPGLNAPGTSTSLSSVGSTSSFSNESNGEHRGSISLRRTGSDVPASSGTNRDGNKDATEGEPVCSACLAIATASANERLSKLHERANQLGRPSHQTDITVEIRRALHDLCERKRLESAASSSMDPAATAAALAEAAAIGRSQAMSTPIIRGGQPQSSPASVVSTATTVVATSTPASSVGPLTSPPSTVSVTPSVAAKSSSAAPAVPAPRPPSTPSSTTRALPSTMLEGTTSTPNPAAASPPPPPSRRPSTESTAEVKDKALASPVMYGLHGLTATALSDLYSDTLNGIEVEEEDDYNDYDDFEFEGSTQGSRHSRHLDDSDDEVDEVPVVKKESLRSDSDFDSDYENDVHDLLETDILAASCRSGSDAYSHSAEQSVQLRNRARTTRKMALRRISHLATLLPTGVGIARLIFSCEAPSLNVSCILPGLEQKEPSGNLNSSINAIKAGLKVASSSTSSGSDASSLTRVDQGERLIVVARGSTLFGRDADATDPAAMAARPYVAAFILTSDVARRLVSLARHHMSRDSRGQISASELQTLRVPLLRIPATYLVELGPSYLVQSLLACFGMTDEILKSSHSPHPRRRRATDCPVAPWFRPLRDEPQYFEIATDYIGSTDVDAEETQESILSNVLKANRGDIFFALQPARQPGLPAFLSSTRKRAAWLAGVNLSTRQVGYLPSTLLVPQHRGLATNRFPTVQFASARPEITLPTTPNESGIVPDSNTSEESNTHSSGYFSFLSKGVSSVKGAVSSVFKSYASPSAGETSPQAHPASTSGGFAGFFSSVLGVGNGSSRSGTPETDVDAKPQHATISSLAGLQAACYDKPSLGVLQTLRILEGLVIANVGK